MTDADDVQRKAFEDARARLALQRCALHRLEGGKFLVVDVRSGGWSAEVAGLYEVRALLQRLEGRPT
jgi:hypothetical protein